MSIPTAPPQEKDGTVPAREEMPLQQFDRDINILPTSNVPALPGTALSSSQTTAPPRPKIFPTNSGKTQLINNGKVAIPRQRANTAPRHTRRVPRACQSCRQRKTKCSGDMPVCRQCKELGITCCYPVSWKERTYRQLEELSSKTREYETLLKDIGNYVDGRTAERIKDTLEKLSPDTDHPSTEPKLQSITPEDDAMDQHPDDASSPSSIGSLEAIERVEEDLNRTEDTRATGYMGKNSEVTWMQRLRREAEQRSKKESGTYEPDPDNESDYALHSMSYHLDDMSITVPGPIQVYQMPPQELADQLFEDYLSSVHPSFPIISRPLFCAQYRTFFNQAARPGDKWLAILNLIFAIAAKHAHLKQAPWRGEEHDHLVYLTRARILSMNGDVLFSHPDLQQVQVEGLISFYLLASDQINRAWKIAALAVRSAVTLGINMKNTSGFTAKISKEARYRVWWCLYTFEHMLGIMTGRATCILDGVCTTPLPLPFEGDQLQDPMASKLLNDQDLRIEYVGTSLASSYVRQMSANPAGGRDSKHTDTPRDASWLQSLPPTNALCFLYYADLAVISQEIVNRVYSPDCAMVPWAHIENRVGALRSRIDLWHANLHKAFDFAHRDRENEEPGLLRSKLFLAFHYYSARITLGRPCLCRRDAHEGSQGNEKPSFSHVMAIITLDSAIQMLDLVPDNPDAIQLYEIGPWWCVLHYLMQAVTVLLLELSFGSIHVPDKEQGILEAAKKGVRWFYSMSKFSVASRRAWQLCDMNLRKIALGMNYTVSDIPTFVHEDKPEQSINAHLSGTIPNGNGTSSHPSSNQPTYGTSTGTHTTNALFNTTDIAEHPQPQATNFDVQPPGLPASDLMNMNISNVPHGGDVCFPYDPINEEFIKYYFPTFHGEENDELY